MPGLRSIETNSAQIRLVSSAGDEIVITAQELKDAYDNAPGNPEQKKAKVKEDKRGKMAGIGNGKMIHFDGVDFDFDTDDGKPKGCSVRHA